MILAAVVPLAMFWRGRRDSAGAARWALPATALVAILLFYPMLDLLRLSLTDATVAGARYAYTLASYRALLTDTSFYGMVDVTIAFVTGSVILQLVIGFGIAWLIDAARRHRTPGTLGRRYRGRHDVGDPRVLAGVLWKILLDREPLRDRELLSGTARPRSSAADLFTRSRAGVGDCRQRRRGYAFA